MGQAKKRGTFEERKEQAKVSGANLMVPDMHKVKRTIVPVDLSICLAELREAVDTRQSGMSIMNGIYGNNAGRPKTVKWNEWVFSYKVAESPEQEGRFKRYLLVGIPGTLIEEIPYEQADMIMCACHKTVFDSMAFSTVPDIEAVTPECMMLSQEFLPVFRTRPRMVRN